MVIKIAHAVKNDAFDNEILIDTLNVLVRLYTEQYVVKADMSESEKIQVNNNRAGALKRINELIKEAKSKGIIIPKDLSNKIKKIKFKQINKEE